MMSVTSAESRRNGVTATKKMRLRTRSEVEPAEAGFSSTLGAGRIVLGAPA